MAKQTTNNTSEIYPGILDQFPDNSSDLPAPAEPSLNSSDYPLNQQQNSQQSSLSSSNEYLPQLRLDVHPSRGS